MTPFEQTEAALGLAKSVHHVFAGKPPEIQGAALVDLVATHVAGHVVPGSQKKTGLLRAELLDLFMDAVEQLIPIADAELKTELKRREKP
jgi:hypothetical protein